MRFELLEITPELADEWLRNTKGPQRALRRRAGLIAEDIRRGHWRITHQAIALDSKGNVIDGQHRLTAVVITGIPIKAWVALDAEPSTFAVIDTGFTRSVSDVLQIAGHANTAKLGAAARLFMAHALVTGTTDALPMKIITRADVAEFMATPDGEVLENFALPRASAVGREIGRFGYITPLTVFLAHAFLRGHHDDLGEFADRLQHGDSLPANSPIFALRKWLIGVTGYQEISSARKSPVALAVTIKAFNDYCAGRDRTVVMFKSTEPWPQVFDRR